MNKFTITATDTVADVCRKLRSVLDEEKLIDENLSVSGLPYQPFWSLLDQYRWIACYVVAGGSEGHYVHVDLVAGYDREWTGKVLHLITGKTFLGLSHAQKIASRCAEPRTPCSSQSTETEPWPIPLCFAGGGTEAGRSSLCSQRSQPTFMADAVRVI